MPIPRLSGELSREQIIEKYKEFGWSKKLQYDWIEVDQRNNAFIKKTYDVNADAMPCSSNDDASYQLSFIQFVSTGIVWTCANCRRTEGPLSIEAAGIRLIGQKTVNLSEAWDIIKKTGQKKPIGMPLLSGKEGFRIK